MPRRRSRNLKLLWKIPNAEEAGLPLHRRMRPPRSSAPVVKRGLHSVRTDPLVLFGSRDRRRKTAFSFRGIHKDDMSSAITYHIQAGVPLCSRPATSFRITWVAVHGIDSICVVARSKDLEERDPLTHVRDISEDLIKCFWNAIISEVEDIAASFGESCQRFEESCKKPFGVVSVIQDTNKVHKASSAEYDVEKAFEFLQEEMESGAVFTFDKTTQTSIFAFQHLFRQEFEADEIRAFVLKKGEYMGRELKQIREDFDIEEFLAIINGA